MIERDYAFVVIGGGLSGLCCALAAARHGVRTALVHNRPMLGGNGSSEIRMHVCGAGALCLARKNARETGIIEELLLENKRRNPNHCFPVFDSVMWEKAKAEPNLDLYLNCHIFETETVDGRILSVSGVQLTTEKRFTFRAPLFADATGDAFIAAEAGATIMRGTESSATYGEAPAPAEATPYTMGNSLLFQAVDRGHPMPYTPPAWANHYTEEDLHLRDHDEIASGYWWIELGGEKDTIADYEEIRDDLLKVVYGVWDHIKNGGDHGAENYELSWVQALPGKRESRRVKGDYVLTANDLLETRTFPDAVAYGGWPIDVHPPCGITGAGSDANHFYDLPDVYQIPYRCLYAADVENLFVAGRAFSLTHAAFASARVMGTTSVVGQAVGTAAAYCTQYGLLPRGLYEAGRIGALQQTLLRDGCYIPGIRNEDEGDLARQARLTVSSGDASGLSTGVARPVHDAENAWCADASDARPVLTVALNAPAPVSCVLLTFDSDLNSDLLITMDPPCVRDYRKTPPPSLVRDFSVELLLAGETVCRQDVADSCIRTYQATFPPTTCDTVRVTITRTWGAETVRLFEARVYADEE